jgi:Ca-activated chloride channel homolog
VASLWARAMIGMWDDEESVSPGSRKDDITRVALAHSLTSRYTSFVAVDREVSRPRSEPLIPVAQRIPLPEGVSRSALGDLSRTDIPPGDPFIEVAAPADARSVTALFPFGLVKALRYDVARELWRGRFLVPAGIPDGFYEIVVAIVHADGRVEYRRQTYHLDSEVAEFSCSFDRVRVRAGRGFSLDVDAVESAAEVYAHSEALGIRRAALEPADEDDRIDWSGWFEVGADVAPGVYPLLVVVRDDAGNRVERTLEVGVY